MARCGYQDSVLGITPVAMGVQRFCEDGSIFKLPLTVHNR